MTSLSLWVKRHPLIAFYLLAFAFTWLGWVPQALYSRGLFPFDSFLFYVLGGVGPLLAIFLTHSLMDGKVDYGAIFRPLGQWRVAPQWYAAALLLWPAMMAAVWAVGGFSGPSPLKLEAPLSALAGMAVYFVAAIPEEAAWRGFALPRLQARQSALTASLIVGLLWGLWHLPLLLNLNNPMSAHPLGLYLLDVIGRSVIYAWLFNGTRGSLLPITLLHAVSNTIGSFSGVPNLIVTGVTAAAIIFLAGPAELKRPAPRADGLAETAEK